jgi:hypothetical protein
MELINILCKRNVEVKVGCAIKNKKEKETEEGRKWHNEEFHNLDPSLNIIIRKFKWADIKFIHILVGKFQGVRPIRKRGRRWRGFKMNFR